MTHREAWRVGRALCEVLPSLIRARITTAGSQLVVRVELDGPVDAENYLFNRGDFDTEPEAPSTST